VNDRELNINDSINGFCFGERDGIDMRKTAVGELGEEDKADQVVRERVRAICDLLPALAFEEVVVDSAVGLIKRCMEARDQKKFSFPKDLKVLDAAAIIAILDRNTRLAGVVTEEEVIARCVFGKLKGVEDRVREKIAEMDAVGLLGARGMGDLDRIKLYTKAFLRAHGAPFTLDEYVLKLFMEAIDGVWFNGKSPKAVAGYVIYHIFLGRCGVCDNETSKMGAYRGRTCLKKYDTVAAMIEDIRRDKNSQNFITNVGKKFKFSASMAPKCSLLITQKHSSRNPHNINNAAGSVAL
jgi:hypothetical protein